MKYDAHGTASALDKKTLSQGKSIGGQNMKRNIQIVLAVAAMTVTLGAATYALAGCCDTPETSPCCSQPNSGCCK